MRLLVTGGTGFVGSHLVEHLLVNTEDEVVVLGSLCHRGCVERLTDSDHWRRHPERVAFHLHDLRAPISPVLEARIGRVDAIFNLAAESHVDRSLEDPVPFITNNVALQLSVLEYARRAKPRALFQFSTDEVYGPANVGKGHPEWAAILPSNPYAASKAAQEALSIAYWRSYGVPLVITNAMNLYGERQDPEKYIPKIIRAILLGQTITIHGTPTQVGSRFYLHARNAADALLYLWRCVLQDPKLPHAYDPATLGGVDRPDRYNVVGEVEVDNLRLAHTIVEIVGTKPLKYELLDFHAARPGHDRRYGLDGKKLADLGWRAPVAFRPALERTVRWYLEHPEWLGLPSHQNPALAVADQQEATWTEARIDRLLRWMRIHA
jgi:dTDP-glucose 4,6-dehydratase